MREPCLSMHMVSVRPYSNVLDFDFEKLCSVSLSHLNVYACLVCGKYFQGRGQRTHAYMHSVDTDHRVYLNLHSLQFYCLPDNYQVKDSSLDDIVVSFHPFFCLFVLFYSVVCFVVHVPCVK